jgi:DNA-binding MarR family transcriptional regulator
MVKRLTNPFRDAPPPLGMLLSSASQRLSAELTAALAAAGFPALRAAHAPLLMAIAPEGSRVSELAERTRMTPQAVGELIRYLQDAGLLAVGPDPDDRRAKRVALTDDGWAALDTGARVVADFDAWLARSIGSEQVERLRAALLRIIETEPERRD